MKVKCYYCQKLVNLDDSEMVLVRLKPDQPKNSRPACWNCIRAQLNKTGHIEIARLD
jgi:uncharacterized protein YlaI